MSGFPARTTLGRSGLRVSKLGLGASFKAPTASYLEAFERGVNYFYWGSIRRSLMGDAVRDSGVEWYRPVSFSLAAFSREHGVLRDPLLTREPGPSHLAFGFSMPRGAVCRHR